MGLTLGQVKHVAKLANIPLTGKEEEKYLEQLAKILGYFEDLNSVDTDGVEPTFNVSGQTNVESKDEVGGCVISQEEALSNTPKKENGFFVTKEVFKEVWMHNPGLST